jgi:hypothetical protein
MNGRHPPKGYEWVYFCERCEEGWFHVSFSAKSNYPRCFCLKYEKPCFPAWRRCKKERAQ